MRTYYDSKASKTLEPRLFGALGHELATGPSVFFFFFFSNSEGRNTESCGIRQSWLMVMLGDSMAGRVLDAQL